MTKGILGKKVGMTQIFTEAGEFIPVTVIEATPNVVLQVKTVETDGYEAVQVGFDDKREVLSNKPAKGHVAKANTAPKRFIREFKNIEGLEVGQEITVDGKNYYLDQNTGALLKNSYRNWSEKQIIPRYKTNYIYHTSYFNRDGIRATGLVKTAAGFIHYFDENGELLKNVAVNVGDTTYVFGEGGRLARNSFYLG